MSTTQKIGMRTGTHTQRRRLNRIGTRRNGHSGARGGGTKARKHRPSPRRKPRNGPRRTARVRTNPRRRPGNVATGHSAPNTQLFPIPDTSPLRTIRSTNSTGPLPNSIMHLGMRTNGSRRNGQGHKHKQSTPTNPRRRHVNYHQRAHRRPLQIIHGRIRGTGRRVRTEIRTKHKQLTHVRIVRLPVTGMTNKVRNNKMISPSIVTGHNKGRRHRRHGRPRHINSPTTRALSVLHRNRHHSNSGHDSSVSGRKSLPRHGPSTQANAS